MKNKLIILKIGGSVITDKASNKALFNKKITKQICKEIKEAQKEMDFDLIVVHGAGSFGHPLAKKYNLDKGYVNAKTSKGITLTKKEVLKLNLLVIEELENAGLNPCLVETSAVAKTSNKEIYQFNLTPIMDLLSNSMTPILSGDVVPDDKNGVAILSGDQIVTYLAKKLSATRVIFASDVDGVFDRNPKLDKSAKVIPDINKNNYRAIIYKMTSYNKSDTTGEMKGKILSIKKDLKRISVTIINGSVKGRIKNALLNRVDGTRIFF